MALHFLDCHCMIGKRADRRPGEPWGVEELAADMDHAGIAEALVIHAWSRDYDPRRGNEELCRQVTGLEHLKKVWAVVPPATGEVGTTEEFMRAALAADVAAVVAYPRLQNFSLSPWSMEPLFTSLALHRMPLLLPFAETGWDEVYRICRDHPRLPVIITGLNYRQLRFLLPLWEHCTNLYVDLSWLSIHDGLGYLAGCGRLDQVLFGTNYPRYAPGPAVTMVTYAAIPESAKRMVAGGTLQRLIGDIRKDPA